MRIILNAGHGAGKEHNRGGIYFNEGDNNYLYSLVLKEELEKYKNVAVGLIRSKIEDNPSLSQRAKAGEGYDLYIAIHSNAAGADVRGTEVWDSVEKPNKALAQKICNVTANLFEHNNRGVKYKEGKNGWNWYGELRMNKAKSAMIIENGFHTNKEDCKFFKDNHKKLAEAQAKVIAEYYGLKKRGEEKEDKPSSWAVEAWNWGIKEGIIDGRRPKEKATREELITILYRLNKINGGR